MATSSLSERLRQKIGQRDVEVFAEASGISRATLYRLIDGATPSVATLRKLRAAGVTIPNDLLSA